MRDLHTTSAREAALFERQRADEPPERPDHESAQRSDTYEGICGGCKRPVSPMDRDGSCIWKRGPWHPACREADRQSVTLEQAA